MAFSLVSNALSPMSGTAQEMEAKVEELRKRHFYQQIVYIFIQSFTNLNTCRLIVLP